MKFKVILFYIFSLQLCFTQNLKFDHYTTIDGLPINETRKIIKDSLGYFWFGTPSGLSRFDGYRFLTFNNNSNGNYSIKDNRIFSLVASKSKIWIGTQEGLSVIDNKTLQLLNTDELTKSLGTNIITFLFVDEKNFIWISNGIQNFIVNPKTFETNEILKGYTLVCASKGINNHYLIGTDKGLLRYNPTNNKLKKVYDIGSFNSYSYDKIYTDSYGVIWITYQGGIYSYQPSRDRFIKMIDFSNGNSISEDIDGSILFGSYGKGLLKYNRISGNFKKITTNPLDNKSISSNDVYDIFTNDDGLIWVGTQEGLDFYDPSQNKFKKLINYPNNPNGLSSSFVQAIFEDDHKVFWIGLRKGVDQVTFKQGYDTPEFKRFSGKGKSFQVLSESYITSIFKDSKDRLWFGTLYNGLFMYLEEKHILKNFTSVNGVNKSIASNSVLSVTEDNLGQIWFGTSVGASLLIENKNSELTFNNIDDFSDKSEDRLLKEVYMIFQDSRERIWMAMNNGGVALVNKKDKSYSFTYFKNDPINVRSLSNNEVFVIFEDSKNRLWFGTSQEGLNMLIEDNVDHPENYYFQRYSKKDGLSDNEIDGILEDDQGNLWIATNNGLSKFNLETEIFTNYTTYDGVLKGKFRKNAAFKNKDSLLFFGGTSGINYFDANNLRVNKVIPRPVFTNLFIDNRKIEPNDKIRNKVIYSDYLGSGTTITLPSDNNRFLLNFSALSYNSPIRNQYSYKLEGFDHEWQFVTGDNPHANYSNLPAGNYRFNLKASNNDGNWSDEIINLDVTVDYMFFTKKTILFFSLFLLTLIIFYGILIIKKRREQKLLDSLQKAPRKKKTIVDPETDIKNKKLVTILLQQIEEKKMYLNPNLSLNELSKLLNVNNNHISLLLNDYIEKNFYDLINHYRIEEVKKRLVDSKFNNQTLSSIGLDCGFNSKSAFNRVFKNLTNLTPSEYKVNYTPPIKNNR